jgi:hypothetical protein
VILFDHDRRVASTRSNENGEFQLEFVMRRNLILSVSLNPGSPVKLPIINCLTKPENVHHAKKMKKTVFADTGTLTH